jgi:hypothetical protein
MGFNKILIALVLSILITIFTMSSAIGISFVYFHIAALAICMVLGEDRREKYDLIRIYISVFTVYIIYILIANGGYLEYNDFYIYPDQGYFYPNIDALSNSSSIESIYTQTLVDRVHRDYEGFFFLQGTIAYLSERYFSGNSVLLQSLHIGYCAILLNLFVFKILKNYVFRENAIKHTIFFAILTPVFYYSPWIFRDIPIALSYAVAIYLMHTKFRPVIFLYYGILVLVTMEFRLEHGLFLLIFPFLYLYNNRASNSVMVKLWPFILPIGVLSFLGVLFVFLTEFIFSLETLQTYDNYTIEALNDGFGAQLYKLPYGIRQVALVLNSQITPLPPWAGVSFDKPFFVVITGIVNMITTMFWSFVFIFTLFCLFVSSVRAQIPKSMWILLMVFVLFVLLNSVNMNVRRILGVYPILYLIYVSLRVNILSSKQSRKLGEYALITYMGLLTLYIILKAML